MSNTYTNVLSGAPVQPADVTFNSIEFTEPSQTIVLSWPPQYETNLVVSDILHVNPLGGNTNCLLELPDATLAPTYSYLICRNIGAESFSVVDAHGGYIVTPLAPGLAYLIYLTDNSTPEGVWSFIQYGAGSSSALASDLVGQGITVLPLLNQGLNVYTPVQSLSDLLPSYDVQDVDRGTLVSWTGGVGSINLPPISADNIGDGYIVALKNNTTQNAQITVYPNGSDTLDLIYTSTLGNGQPLSPTESAYYIAKDNNWSTVGRGLLNAQEVTIATIDVPNNIDVSDVEALSQIQILTSSNAGPYTVDYPQRPQVYYITLTSGSTNYVNLKCTGTGSITTILVPGQSMQFYCDGIDLIEIPNVLDGTPLFPGISFDSNRHAGFRYVNTGDDNAPYIGVDINNAGNDPTLDIARFVTGPAQKGLYVQDTLGFLNSSNGTYIQNVETNPSYEMNFNVQGILMMSLLYNSTTPSYQLLLGRNGTAAYPTLSFTSHATTGLYYDATYGLGLTSAGTLGAFLNATQQFGLPSAGGPTAPSFWFNSNGLTHAGFYTTGQGINVCMSDTQICCFNNNQIIVYPQGAHDNPAIALTGNGSGNTGFYINNVNQIALTHNGFPSAYFINTQIEFTPSGTVGTPIVPGLLFSGLGSTNTGFYLPATNQIGVSLNGLPSLLCTDSNVKSSTTGTSNSFSVLQASNGNVSPNTTLQLIGGRGTLTALTQIKSTDVIGSFQAAGYYNASSIVGSAGMDVVATIDFTASVAGSKLIFYTIPNASTVRTPALTLNQDQSAVFAGSVTFSAGQLLGANGTQALPFYSFTNASSSGYWLSDATVASPSISISLANTLVTKYFRVASLNPAEPGVYYNQFLAPDGENTTTYGNFYLQPGFAFTGDTDTGMLRLASNAFGFSAGGCPQISMLKGGFTISLVTLGGFYNFYNGRARTEIVTQTTSTDQLLRLNCYSGDSLTTPTSGIIAFRSARADFNTALSGAVAVSGDLLGSIQFSGLQSTTIDDFYVGAQIYSSATEVWNNSANNGTAIRFKLNPIGVRNFVNDVSILTGNGATFQWQMPNGTVVQPGIGFRADAGSFPNLGNSGFYYVASNQIGISTNGVETGYFSPSILRFTNQGANNNGLTFYQYRGSNVASTLYIQMIGSRGTATTSAAIGLNDIFGGIRFSGVGDAISTAIGLPGIDMVAAENFVASTNAGCNMLFYTTPNLSITRALALTLSNDQTATFAKGVTLTTGNLVVSTGNISTTAGTITSAGLLTASAALTVSSGLTTLPNGTAVAPSLIFSAAATSGFYGTASAISTAISGVNATTYTASLISKQTTATTFGYTFTQVSGGVSNPNAGIEIIGGRGTLATKTAIQLNDIFGIVQCSGYNDQPAVVGTSRLEWKATENWAHTGTHAGCQVNFYTTANGSETSTLALTLGQDQSATFAAPILASTSTSLTNCVYSFNGDPNCGISYVSADSFSLVTNSLARITFSTTVITKTLPMRGENGSGGGAGTPTYSFANSTTSGMWYDGVANVMLSAAGANALQIGATNITALQQLTIPDGTAGSPITPGLNFSTASFTGLYKAAADTLGICCNTNAAVATYAATLITFNQVLKLPVGSNNAPSVYFGTAGTGIYGDATNVYFAAATVNVATINSSGVTAAATAGTCILSPTWVNLNQASGGATSPQPYFYTQVTRGTQASSTVIKSGDQLLELRCAGNYASSGPPTYTNSIGCARLFLAANQDFTSSANGTNIQFWTTPNGSAAASVAESMRILGGGTTTALVGIGRTPVTNNLEVNGTASNTAGGSWAVNSDKRIKENIKDIPDALGIIKQLHPCTYRYTQEHIDYNQSYEKDGVEKFNYFKKFDEYYGFIADEVELVLPRCVDIGNDKSGEHENLKQFNATDIHILGIKAIQELSQENQVLKDQIGDLKKRLEILEGKI